MLQFLQDRVSERKARLFACACTRKVWGFLTHVHSREAVEAAERFADGLISKRELELAGARARIAASSSNSSRLAARVARFRLSGTMDEGIGRVGPEKSVSILQELFNPFLPSVAIESATLAWNDNTVVRIAQTIYAERGFDRMPILADALEDAGCDNADILAHCRGPNEHVRGCWVVDLILEKQ